ncbi:hypothetical protein JXA63_00780, partial [Candidatus Woesebacteria bacterium]|nr:hypothetical protein [Candidatus Woesebacteria bacterium]
RAFNSKLLIAQVLGRGLRIPEVYKGKDDIRVRVYNHIKFSSHIKNLVDEVLELENRFCWFPISSQDKYNFKLHNLNYIKDLEFKQEKRKKVEFSEKINLGPQSKTFENYNIFRDVVTGEEVVSKYNVDTVAFDIEIAAKTIWAMLGAYDLEKETEFRIQYPWSKIKQILKKNLPADSNEFISYENLNKAKTAFGKLFDVGGSFPYFKNRVDQLVTLNTSVITKQSISSVSLKREAMCFYTENTVNSLEDDERSTFKDILENEEEYKVKEIDSEKFKSPLNCLTVSHEPERKFSKVLFQNTDLYDSFVKNPDKSFYSIPYSYKKGTHMKYLNFHPDFFFKIGEDILSVEIKKDNDDSRENSAKNRDALKHFDMVNEVQNEQNYHFYFLSPEDYVVFFQAIRENRYHKWQSSLMKMLS